MAGWGHMMKTPKLLDTIDRDQALQELDDALNSRENVRLHERYQAVNMVVQGHSYQTISQMVKRSMTTIGRYVEAYRQEGLSGLAMIRPTGRPRRLTEAQEQQLYDLIVEKTPADVGFPAEVNWRAPLLQEWLRREWDQSYSDRGVRALLYRLNMSFTCPTYTLAKADPVKQEAFRQTFRKLQIQWVLGSVDRLWLQDESMIRDDQALTRTWFPKGQPKIIPTFGKHWGAKMLGTLDYVTGEVFCLLHDHDDGASVSRVSGTDGRPVSGRKGGHDSR